MRIGQLFSPAAGCFSRSRLWSTQGVRVYTPAQVWVPAGLGDARSGRSKSRDLVSNHEIVLRRARDNQAHGIPQNCHLFFVFPVFLAPLFVFLKYHSRRQRLGSHGTSRASSFPLCDSHERCFCVCTRKHAYVCVCVCVIIGSFSSRSQEHGFKKRCAIQLFFSLFLRWCLLLLMLLLCACNTPRF